MAVHLLDTDLLIDFLRGRAEARALLGSYDVFSNRPVVSVVSVSEIWAGAKSAEAVATNALLSTMGQIPVSEKIAWAAGTFLNTYRSSHGVEVADALIAASAVEIGATLLTRNVKHYPMPAVKLQRPY